MSRFLKPAPSTNATSSTTNWFLRGRPPSLQPLYVVRPVRLALRALQHGIGGVVLFEPLGLRIPRERLFELHRRVRNQAGAARTMPVLHWRDGSLTRADAG